MDALPNPELFGLITQATVGNKVQDAISRLVRYQQLDSDKVTSDEEIQSIVDLRTFVSTKTEVSFFLVISLVSPNADDISKAFNVQLKHLIAGEDLRT